MSQRDNNVPRTAPCRQRDQQQHADLGQQHIRNLAPAEAQHSQRRQIPLLFSECDARSRVGNLRPP
jgi:hypothetical protein